jgi:hypothetical protein
MYVTTGGAQWGDWDKQESLEEFLASWVQQGKQKVPYFRAEYTTFYEPDTLIESWMDKSNSRDLGVGFDVRPFSYDGVDYVAYVAYGDQNLCDVETAEDWNRRVSTLLVP